jgi:hypothetical protein
VYETIWLEGEKMKSEHKKIANFAFSYQPGSE